MVIIWQYPPVSVYIHLYLLSPSEAALAKHTADGAASGAEGEGKQQG